MAEDAWLAGVEISQRQADRRHAPDEDYQVGPADKAPQRRKQRVQEDDEGDEPEGVVDRHHVGVAEEGVNPQVVQHDVLGPEMKVQEMRVGQEERREDDPVGGIDPPEPAQKEPPRALLRRAEHEADAAQDDEHVDADLEVQRVRPGQHAARVVENDEQDRHALELVENAYPARNRRRQVDAHRCGHGARDGGRPWPASGILCRRECSAEASATATASATRIPAASERCVTAAPGNSQCCARMLYSRISGWWMRKISRERSPRNLSAPRVPALKYGRIIRAYTTMSAAPTQTETKTKFWVKGT